MQILTSIRAKHLGPRLILDGKPFIGGICLHDTAGSGTHNDTLYLANPNDGRVVSVDYTVERNGDVYELNPDVLRKCTWHAGRATSYRVGNRVFKNRAATQVLIGIELSHKANPALQTPIWPDEQVKAVAELCIFLCTRYGLTKDQITTHAKIITDGSRTDPRTFPFDAFWTFFNRQANTPAINPAAPDLTSPLTYTVKPGDSLWKIGRQFSKSIEELKSLNGIDAASNLIVPGQVLIVRK